MRFERPPFTLEEARSYWSRMVAGWADSLNPEGTKTFMDGIHFEYDDGGSQEGVTRMMWGLGGWLSRPERDAKVTWRGVTYDAEVLARRALLNGTDPGSPGYWGESPFPGSPDIWMVDAGQVAFAVWQSRSRIWDHLEASEKEQIVLWLEKCAGHPGEFRNNFALFWGLNHACRKALGQRHDSGLIDDVYDYVDRVYCGEGWYDDGPARGSNNFDDYNFWVFASHTLAMANVDGDAPLGRREETRGRVRQLMESYPYHFATTGAYTEHGRSLAYKFGRLGAPLLAYQQRCWPHEPGMLRRLVGNHLRWYFDRGVMRADGTLRQELTSQGSDELREGYISTGSSYWATQAFGGLWSISDDDRFWTDEESPLPVERADFVRTLPVPGWVLVGNKETGEVQRFSAIGGRYPAKYGKYHYTTAAPFNVGQVDGRPSPDGMLCLVSGQNVGHRGMSISSAVGESGWLRFRYVQNLGEAEHVIETAIVPFGNRHIRIHKIELADGSACMSAVEGAGALGYAPGDDIQSGHSEDPPTSWALARERSGSRFIEIRGLNGYSSADRPASWAGRNDLNCVFGRYVLPLLRIDQVVSGQVLVCEVTIGTDRDRDAVRKSFEVAWKADDTIELISPDGSRVTIPPLG